VGRRRASLCVTIAAGAALLAGCTTQVDGTPTSSDAPSGGPNTAVATKPAQAVMDGLRDQGYDCGQAALTPAPVWQCFAYTADGVAHTFTFQLRADGTTGGVLAYVTPADPTGDALPKQTVDEVVEGLLPEVLDEPQLHEVQDWVHAPSPTPATVHGLQLDYAQTTVGGKFELLTPGTESLRAVNAIEVLNSAMPQVQLSAVQAFAESNEMTCDASSSGSLSCAQKPMFFRSINASPGTSGDANSGVGQATFRFRTDDRVAAVALFSEFARVISPDGAPATGEWLNQRLGNDGKFSIAAPEKVTFTVKADRSSGSNPEYTINAMPSLF
jgi:hypothetical protein